MAFTFIHTGDWHLAKPFGRFDAEKAPLLRDARLRIVDRIAELAKQTGAEAVLVAGDVFDGPMVGDGVLRKLAARLENYAEIEWHFLPGNHDPSTANGVWQRFAKFATGEHVIVHHEAGLRPVKPGVDVLVAPLHARAISHDPTEWMSERAGDGRSIRIGLAHGAVQGFGSSGEASVMISPNRAVQAGLDYLALGDWHGTKEVGPKAWYAGTPEPDQFPDNEPGYALSVSIAAVGSEPEIMRHKVAQYSWQRHVFEGDLMVVLDALEGKLVRSGEAANTLLRIEFTGRITLDEEIALRARVERLEDQAFHCEADFDQLTIDAGGLATETFADPLLAAVGARLSASMSAGGADGEIAHEALMVLTRHARASEGAV